MRCTAPLAGLRSFTSCSLSVRDAHTTNTWRRGVVHALLNAFRQNLVYEHEIWCLHSGVFEREILHSLVWYTVSEVGSASLRFFGKHMPGYKETRPMKRSLFSSELYLCYVKLSTSTSASIFRWPRHSLGGWTLESQIRASGFIIW
jgi:hypothetical protein